MKFVNAVLLAVMLLLPPLSVGLASPAAVIPTITIVSVVPDQSVTIQTHNFPANVKFTAMMGKFGTLGIKGTVVGTTDSGNGGSFQATYNIPSDLKGQKLIAIRLEGTGGYFSYNWFTNVASGASSTPSPTQSSTQTSGSTYTGIPTFSIVSVVKDTSVTIKTNNFPANQTFTVTMGKYGTRGVNGTKVTTTDSGKGGAFTVTYNIPSGLQGTSPIAIRLESSQGYYAYNWFYNGTYGTGTTSTPSPTGTAVPATQAAPGATATPKATTVVPTFSIVSVVPGKTVTIKTSNFPANQTFTVRMGKYGTLGVNGTKVTTTDSGKGGSFEVTYDIPSALAKESIIAIRLESSQGYFAYNWFYN